jgi:MoaE-MoaD fusion protein
MQVRVLFFGVLKEMAGSSEQSVHLDAPTTVGQLFEQFAQTMEGLADRRGSILFARNHEFSSAEATVTDGDEIAFLPPVSGGSRPSSDPDRSPCAITREPIDARALARRVQREEDGAVITFEGIVRNNTAGRRTLYLDYEAYEELAVAQMDRISEEVRQQFSAGRVGAVHRLGRLQIGEASIAIAVSAPHRRPAFAAALEFIDRLKREVPIWKKEHFADGEVWVEGEWDPQLVGTSQAQ